MEYRLEIHADSGRQYNFITSKKTWTKVDPTVAIPTQSNAGDPFKLPALECVLSFARKQHKPLCPCKRWKPRSVPKNQAQQQKLGKRMAETNYSHYKPMFIVHLPALFTVLCVLFGANLAFPFLPQDSWPFWLESMFEVTAGNGKGLEVQQNNIRP